MTTVASMVMNKPIVASCGRVIDGGRGRALLLLMLRARRRSAYATSSAPTTTAREHNPLRQRVVPSVGDYAQSHSSYNKDLIAFRRYSDFRAAACGFQFHQERRNCDGPGLPRRHWGTQVARIQTTAKGAASDDPKDRNKPQRSTRQEETELGTSDVNHPDGLFKMRKRLNKARWEATEDAKDWIRVKRDDMDEMRETLRDAQKEGRLGAELSDQAKESTGKLRALWHKYGYVSIGTYVFIYVSTLVGCFVFYDSGIVTTLPPGTEIVIKHLKDWMKFTPDWAQYYADKAFGAVATGQHAQNFVLAWATCKLTEPLRLVATIAITPRIARALGRAPPKDPDESGEKTKKSHAEG